MTISLDKSAVYLTAGRTDTLAATVMPESAAGRTVTWSCSDTNVATFDSSTGTVTAVAPGNATITATISEWTEGTAGNRTVTCHVHVHGFYYDCDSEGGNYIWAFCNNRSGCTDPKPSATIRIIKPTLETYGETGKSEKATLTNLEKFNDLTGNTIAETDIRYVGRNGTSSREHDRSSRRGQIYRKNHGRGQDRACGI